jgi:hypothetical protein
VYAHLSNLTTNGPVELGGRRTTTFFSIMVRVPREDAGLTKETLISANWLAMDNDSTARVTNSNPLCGCRFGQVTKWQYCRYSKNRLLCFCMMRW